jgi:O-antigen biosynthesis protein
VARKTVAMSHPASTSLPDDSQPAPLVSVIVRSMDRPSLGLALDSIALQDHPNVEVLVVDAQGTAHGPVPTVAGPHPVRVVQSGRPLPRSQAANAGLDAAAGALVIFLDDDDVFLPGHLSRLVAALQSRPGSAAAYSDVDYGRHGAGGWQSEHLFAADFDPLRLRFENFLPLHGVMVDRRSEAGRACRFDETMDLFEDWDWLLQLARVGPFVRVPGVSARYVAAAKGSSGVFDEGAVSSAARLGLLHKWLALDTPAQRLELLLALQRHYRAALHCADQLALARRTEQDLRVIVGDRDLEVTSLRQVLSARQQEVVDSGAQIDALRQVLAAREHEVADFALELQSVRQVLAARDREVADGLEYARGLQQILAAREEEIASLRQRTFGADRLPTQPKK